MSVQRSAAFLSKLVLDSFDLSHRTLILGLLGLVLVKECISIRYILYGGFPIFLVFISLEKYATNCVRTISHTSQTYYQTPKIFIPISFVLFGATFLGMVYAYFLVRINHSFISVYGVASYSSLLIFCLAGGIKCFCIVTGVITYKHIKHGILGLFQRLLFIIRSVVMFPFWYYFMTEPSDTFFRKFSWIVLSYVIIKGCHLFYLLVDFFFSVKNYINNLKVELHSVPKQLVPSYPCPICLNEDYEDPVKLICGHIFCRKCVTPWLCNHCSCPLCRTRIAESKKIEFSDGSIPTSALICSF